jgi:hypothetical protein
MREGEYVVTCDDCQGTGSVRYGLRPFEPCEKCGGIGTLLIREAEIKRSHEQWEMAKDMGIFVALIFLAAAAGVFVALWRLNHWKWF